MKIAPSILSADFGHLSEAVHMLNRSDADAIHIDVMDGVFVPNISFGFPVLEAVAKEAAKPLDVHLMIVHPERYVERFCDAGAWSVGFHLEAVDDPRPILEMIRRKGVRTCLTINPDIDERRLLPYLEEVDMVMLMSVYAGFGGQKFMPEVLDKVRTVREEIDRHELNTMIEIDGGIGVGNARMVEAAGVDMAVAGNAVFRANDPLEAIRLIRG